MAVAPSNKKRPVNDAEDDVDDFFSKGKKPLGRPLSKMKNKKARVTHEEEDSDNSASLGEDVAELNERYLHNIVASMITSIIIAIN